MASDDTILDRYEFTTPSRQMKLTNRGAAKRSYDPTPRLKH